MLNGHAAGIDRHLDQANAISLPISKSVSIVGAKEVICGRSAFTTRNASGAIGRDIQSSRYGLSSPFLIAFRPLGSPAAFYRKEGRRSPDSCLIAKSIDNPFVWEDV